jgi:acetyl esterase/lipase
VVTVSAYDRHECAPNRQTVVMAYFVALASAFLVLSAGTALRPGRRGLFSALAFPVGWAAGELAGQGIAIEGALLGILWWWGWPATSWLGDVVLVVAAISVLENLVLIGIQFRSRTVVRRAMATAPDRPLTIGRPGEDAFGRWWRTALQIPFHPRSMQLLTNIAYGPLERHRLDIWRSPTTSAGAPVIYYIHGGAWTFGDKREQGRPMLHEFVRRGWIVVAINYRLAPRSPWPAQIHDVTRALGWIKQSIATYGGDPDRVIVAGGSAGGQLASLLALSAHDPTWRPEDMSDLSDWSVRGCLSYYGVLEMTGDDAHWNGMGRGLRRLLVQTVVKLPYEGNEPTYAALSPYDRITFDAPPFFVVQGTNDTLVDVNVARGFVTKFRAVAFAPIYYVELPFTQHSFDLTASPRTSATTRAAVAFAESVNAARPSLSADLVASYQVPPTELQLEHDGHWIDVRDAVTDLGPLCVVTSDNPYSQVLSERANEERRQQLRGFLDARHITYCAARGRDLSGTWPDELGVALINATRESSRALALAWEQFAYYEVTSEGVVVRDAASDRVLSNSPRE